MTLPFKELKLPFRLVGECNRCGHCCVPDGYRCLNLQVRGEIGQPNASKCKKYGMRYNGMPIVLQNDKGDMRFGECVVGAADDFVVFERSIGKGCSLEVENVRS